MCDVTDSFAPEMLFYSKHTAHRAKMSMKNIENIINRLLLQNKLFLGKRSEIIFLSE